MKKMFIWLQVFRKPASLPVQYAAPTSLLARIWGAEVKNPDIVGAFHNAQEPIML
ncbi:MAG: hypothetical protein ACKVQQ_02985 [Burkholderiales bacterium]